MDDISSLTFHAVDHAVAATTRFHIHQRSLAHHLHKQNGVFTSGMRTLVLGIGNTLLGDEGAGVHAIHALRERNNDLDEVEFLDGGTLSFTLAASVEDCDNLIVIDAAELQSSPGTVRTYINEDMDRFLGSQRKRSVHEVSLMDLLGVALLTGRLPQRRALIGIQPQHVDWSTAPTPAVAAGIGEACATAESLLREWQS